MDARNGVAQEPAGVGPRVVVGLDGSPSSQAALVRAMAAAAARGASLEVVAAYPVDTYWTDPYLADSGRLEAIRSDTAGRASAMVEEARGDVAVVGAPPQAASLQVDVVVVAGRPAEHLVRQALSADLLVIGCRGRGFVRSSLLGSVALHCAAHARCDVVVVHQLDAAAQVRVVVGLDDTDASREALRHAAQEAQRVGAVLDVVAVSPPELLDRHVHRGGGPPGPTAGAGRGPRPPGRGRGPRAHLAGAATRRPRHGGAGDHRRRADSALPRRTAAGRTHGCWSWAAAAATS